MTNYKQSNSILYDFAQWLGLTPETITFHHSPVSSKLAKQGFRLEQHGGNTTICSPSTAGWAAGLSDVAENGLANTDKEMNPLLTYRAHQRWLPFDMGQQAYGQEGYAVFDRDTHNWWYDKNYWKEYLFELARGRYNAIHLWNVHPYPALIRFKNYPYAAYFDSQRVEQNIEQFTWIVNIAKELGIKIVLMQYNIHVSEGYAKKHGYPWVDNVGWGGKDTADVRRYTRNCLEELFELYPDLGGLMTAGELNRDAFGFYNESIAPVLLNVPCKPTLHFRLWGQQNPDGVKQLTNMMDGQIQLWHKISHEQIWVPKVDSRVGLWRKTIPDVPINVCCGPGMAAGLNYVERVHFDPELWQSQFTHLKEIGGSGIGYFTGEDNYMRNADDYSRRKNAVDARWAAGRASREIVGKIAWGGTSTSQRWRTILDRQLNLTSDTSGIYDLACNINRAYYQLCQILGMYNSQDLGFAYTLGRLSVSTEKEEPGSFCFVAGYAWPEDGFGYTDIPDVRQLAVDYRDTDKGKIVNELIQKFADFRKTIDQYIDHNHLPQRNTQHIHALAAFVHNLRQIVLTSLFRCYVVEAAIAAYRAPFTTDPSSSLELSVKAIDTSLTILNELALQLGKGWAVEATIREDFSDFVIDRRYRPGLQREREGLLRLIEAMRNGIIIKDVYQVYGQSIYYYHEAARYLRTGGYHFSQSAMQKIRNCFSKALAILGNSNYPVVNAWRQFLSDETLRIQQPQISLGIIDGHIELPLLWEGARFYGPEKYVSHMLKLLESSQISSRRIQTHKIVSIDTNAYGLLITLPPLSVTNRKYFKPDEQLAPHEKVSPYIFRANDHYQISVAMPETDYVLNIMAVPGQEAVSGFKGWLNPPHGVREENINVSTIKATWNTDRTQIEIPWAFYGRKPRTDEIWRINICQTRDFWRFVVETWSPMYDPNTFLDKDQLGFIRWV